MRSPDLAAAVLINLLWGVNFAVIDVGPAHLPPLLFCALRSTVAAVPAVFVVGRPRVAWRWVVAVALSLGVVKFGLLFTGMAAGLTAGASALVLQSQAIFTVIFAVAVGQDAAEQEGHAQGERARAGQDGQDGVHGQADDDDVADRADAGPLPQWYPDCSSRRIMRTG